MLLLFPNMALLKIVVCDGTTSRSAQVEACHIGHPLGGLTL